MYSGKHGKASSTKPAKKSMPVWLSYKPKEVETLVVKLAKSGNDPAKIGLILRDTYGIPDVKTVTKKKITQILKENKLSSELPSDLTALIRRFIAIQKHMETNKKDYTGKRGQQLIEAKIKKLVN